MYQHLQREEEIRDELDKLKAQWSARPKQSFAESLVLHGMHVIKMRKLAERHEEITGEEIVKWVWGEMK